MKRIISAVILFMILITICVGTQITTHYIANDTINTLEHANNTADAQTIESTKEITERWDKYERILMSYSNHDDIEAITKAIGVLTEHIECGEFEKFKVECKNAINSLEHLKKTEEPLTENIL